MSKIDIAIKVTSDGVGEPIAVTGGKWTQNVIDIRQVLNNLSGLDMEGQTARILSFTDDGAIVTLAHLVPGRGGDNVAAWIFIPANVDIAGNELVGIVKKTERVIASSEFDLQPLRELCNKEYPNRKSFSKAPTGNRLAFRQYNSASLPRLLGPDRYQPYYDSYRYILLLNAEEQIKLRKAADAEDLTQHLVSTLSMVLPPDTDALRRHFRQDVSVMLADGTPFDHPVAVKKGESFRIFFVREGFKPIEYILTKTDNDAFSPIKLSDIRNFEWKRIINLSLFNFVDEQNQALPSDVHPTVKVNGKILGATDMEIAECELRLVNVEASASIQGYEGIAQFVDLSQPAPYIVRLSRRVYDSKNKVMMRNGKIADMTLVSKYIPNHKNGPFSGYVFDCNGNLIYDTYLVWTHRIQGLIVGLSFALLCWGVSAIVGTMKNKTDTKEIEQTQAGPDDLTTLYHNETSTSSEQQTLQDDIDLNSQEKSLSENCPAIDNTTLKDAIAYLDKNPNWKREEMEHFSNLRGLFDDMNTFNFKKILRIWNEKLKNSTKFKEVVGYAQKIENLQKNPAIGKHSPNYCQDGETTINRQKYINHLYFTIYPEKRSDKYNAIGTNTNNKTKGNASSTKNSDKNVSNKDNGNQSSSTNNYRATTTD